jgi:mono/diheme cytochrome c family protein
MNAFAKKVLIIAFSTFALTFSLWASTPLSPTNATVQSAKSLYQSKCSVCHANDGSGNTAKGRELKVRDFKSPEVKKMTDAQLYKITAEGKGKMEGYEKSLGKEKVQMLIEYCKELMNK